MISTRSPTANSADSTGALGTIGSGRIGGVGALSDTTPAFEHLRDAAQLSDEIGHYHEAIRRGHALLIIEAAEQTEVENVTSVLHNLLTIDIDERAVQWARWGYVGYVIGAGRLLRNRSAPTGTLSTNEKGLRAKVNFFTYGVRLYPHRRDSPPRRVGKLGVGPDDRA